VADLNAIAGISKRQANVGFGPLDKHKREAQAAADKLKAAGVKGARVFRGANGSWFLSSGTPGGAFGKAIGPLGALLTAIATVINPALGAAIGGATALGKRALESSEKKYLSSVGQPPEPMAVPSMLSQLLPSAAVPGVQALVPNLQQAFGQPQLGAAQLVALLSALSRQGA